MINHIDVSSMLRKSVCELYSNLVTRPTGAAVRCEIEQELDRIGDRALTVIDFSHVGLLDFSCADEIVAKLLLQYVSTDAPRREVYFVFRGISESHMYIRLPFLIDGLIKGVLGGLLALLLVWLTNRVINQYFIETIFFDREMIFLGIVGGALMGVIGSLVSVGRHLRRI